jgi:hypothetical protein
MQLAQWRWKLNRAASGRFVEEIIVLYPMMHSEEVCWGTVPMQPAADNSNGIDRVAQRLRPGLASWWGKGESWGLGSHCVGIFAANLIITYHNPYNPQ